jgi:hypothetical protein
MLYNLIKKYRGNETVVMTDQLSLVNDRKKQLSASQRGGIRGQKVQYFVREAAEEEEKKPWIPHDMYLGGANRKHPRVPK